MSLYDVLSIHPIVRPSIHLSVLLSVYPSCPSVTHFWRARDYERTGNPYPFHFSSLIHTFIHTFIHSFIHLFIHLFIIHLIPSLARNIVWLNLDLELGNLPSSFSSPSSSDASSYASSSYYYASISSSNTSWNETFIREMV